MPIPFLVPAGMMAVRIGSKWVLKKIAKRLARRTRLKPKTEKTLKKKAAKQGRKLQKKKGTPPFAKEVSKEARKRPVNPALKEGLKAGEDLKREKDFLKGIEDRITKRIKQRNPGQPGKGKPRSKRRKYVSWVDRRSIKLTDKSMKEAGDKVREKVKEAKANLKKRKRTRQLKEDVQRRRN